jgi:ribosomal protein S18 acetylase RimI-like enzyme
MPQPPQGWFVSTDPGLLDIPYIHGFLTHSYWAEGIPLDTVARSIRGSICFGVYGPQGQAGFGRVITDQATFAYLADVFIDPQFQGMGLGKALMENIMAHPAVQGLRRFLLATRDAHGLYRQFGFDQLTAVDRWMQVHHPDIYRKLS